MTNGGFWERFGGKTWMETKGRQGIGGMIIKKYLADELIRQQKIRNHKVGVLISNKSRQKFSSNQKINKQIYFCVGSHWISKKSNATAHFCWFQVKKNRNFFIVCCVHCRAVVVLCHDPSYLLIFFRFWIPTPIFFLFKWNLKCIFFGFDFYLIFIFFEFNWSI